MFIRKDKEPYEFALAHGVNAQYAMDSMERPIYNLLEADELAFLHRQHALLMERTGKCPLISCCVTERGTIEVKFVVPDEKTDG